MRNYCRWHITPSQTATHTVRGTGGAVVLLPSLRVTAVASVTVGGVLQDAASYSWTSDGVLRRTSGWWAPYETIVVTFTHGFTSMPAEVQTVIDRLAQRVEDGGRELVQAGPFRYASAGGAVLDERADLNAYRVPPIG